MPSNHFILCCLLLLPSSIFPRIRVFSNESILRIRWPKYWNFSFSISPSISPEYSGLISFRIDWLDLLAVQGTLKNLLQQHSSKASILRRSALFIIQLLHPYMTKPRPIRYLHWYILIKKQVYINWIFFFNTINTYFNNTYFGFVCKIILWIRM